MAKRYADATLMAMTKADLVKHLRCAERNEDAANEMLNQQAENFKDWEPVRHGRWIGHSEDDSKADVGCFACGICGFNISAYDKAHMCYCPLCGARMDLED